MDKRQELVRFDWAIKRILRDKANFGVLEGFLSVVLKDDVKIVEILESESNKQSSDDKFNRVDIKARNSKGEIIIVEVQNTREADYLLIVEDFDKVAVTPLEEWLRYLKTGEISEDAQAPGLQEAREKLRLISMSKEDQNAYEKYLHDEASFLYTQKVEKEYAHAEGLAEGLVEGAHREKILIATNMKILGMSAEVISQATGLSADEIESL